MAAANCPHCELLLTSDEAATGVCPSCGKSLGAAPAGRAAPRGGTAASPPRTGLHVHWGYFIGVMLTIPVGLSLFCNCILDDGPRSGATTRRMRSLEDAIGPRGTEAISGLVFLGMAGAFGYGCLKNATMKGFLVAGVPIALNGAIVLGAWIVPAIARGSEFAWQKGVATEIRALPFGVPVERVAQPLTFRKKVLIWDGPRSALSHTQSLLPPERHAKKTDGSFTAIVILKERDDATVKFDSGKPGHTRTLTVAVVEYPEKKIVGTYLVQGESPGFLVLRDARDTSPIVGDTSVPLKNWILSGGKSTYAP